MYPFSTPVDLLRFAPVPFGQRVRFGWNIVNSRFRRRWRQLDRLSARAWLTRQIGARAYEVIWDPLLRIKFGDDHHTVSAAWIWHRIHRVASSRRRLWEAERFGYLEGGSATVVDALLERLAALPNAEVRLATRVEQIVLSDGAVSAVRVSGRSAPEPCSTVVSTVALPILARLAPSSSRATASSCSASTTSGWCAGCCACGGR